MMPESGRTLWPVRPPAAAFAFCRRIRIVPMSFGLRGGFWPTSVPLFQALHFSIASITGFLVVDRSLIFWAGIGTAAIGQDAR